MSEHLRKFGMLLSTSVALGTASIRLVVHPMHLHQQSQANFGFCRPLCAELVEDGPHSFAVNSSEIMQRETPDFLHQSNLFKRRNGSKMS